MNQNLAQAMQCSIEYIRQRYPTSATATHYQSDLMQFAQVVDKAPREVTRADVSHFVTVQLEQGLSAACGWCLRRRPWCRAGWLSDRLSLIRLCSPPAVGAASRYAASRGEDAHHNLEGTHGPSAP